MYIPGTPYVRVVQVIRLQPSICINTPYYQITKYYQVNEYFSAVGLYLHCASSCAWARDKRTAYVSWTPYYIWYLKHEYSPLGFFLYHVASVRDPMVLSAYYTNGASRGSVAPWPWDVVDSVYYLSTNLLLVSPAFGHNYTQLRSYLLNTEDRTTYLPTASASLHAVSPWVWVVCSAKWQPSCCCCCCCCCLYLVWALSLEPDRS
jgi:hypothetical protein